MAITKIFGASDDLIEIEGAISDEIGCYSTAEKGMKIACSDGTTGRIKYDGEWKINITHKGAGFYAFCEIPSFGEHSDLAKGCTNYSEVLIMDNLEWIRIGRKTFKP